MCPSVSGSPMRGSRGSTIICVSPILLVVRMMCVISPFSLVLHGPPRSFLIRLYLSWLLLLRLLLYICILRRGFLVIQERPGRVNSRSGRGRGNMSWRKIFKKVIFMCLLLMSPRPGRVLWPSRRGPGPGGSCDNFSMYLLFWYGISPVCPVYKKRLRVRHGYTTSMWCLNMNSHSL